MNEKIKPVSYSRVQQIQLVMPQHSNSAGRLFGGQLMAWIDLTAGVVAFRNSEGHCTTASVDYLSFDRPIHVKDLIVLDGCITYVGNSSMEIRVDTFTEKAGLIRELANRAYLIFVSIDDNGRPKRTPRLDLQTDAERCEWEEGIRRAELRRQRRVRDGGA
jgi:acyl-CoA hydrolase